MGTLAPSENIFLGIAWANGQGIGYREGGTLYLKQYDRTTTPVGDANVLFALSAYGDLISAETIATATRLPLCTWDSHEHTGGVAVEDPNDFYLAFEVPESKTADGIVRYGWYHLSIDDDLDGMTLLDSGIGLYGEGIYVGIGVTPEPSAGMFLLLGFAALLLTRPRLRSAPPPILIEKID